MAKSIVTSERITEEIKRDWGGSVHIFTGLDCSNESEFLSSRIVIIPKGKCHDKHNHPDSEEVLYCIQGKGIQTFYHDDGEDEVIPITVGDFVWNARGSYHSTHNFEDEDLKLLAVYTTAK